MKLSTRINRYVAPELIEGKSITLMVDCGKTDTIIAATPTTRGTLSNADAAHKFFTNKGYKLLPKESPVVNDSEIVIHYTSTTYKDWCNA